ncbi:hypothetical protein E1176_12255, partial [Fulvivirga sp. RKSG066]|uniref:Ig-like domain-containing protein n=1 Tax=Fulvivirga aurantia TaxID=2529383 RepID=UPI0012BCB099
MALIKIRSFLTLLLLSLSSLSIAQAPSVFNYQILVKDGIGNAVHDHEVAVQITIANSTTTVYQEVFTAVKPVFGQASVLVGTGNATTGIFKNIDWSAGTFTIKSAIDLNGGSDFNISMTSPLNSLPYALHARSLGQVRDMTADARDQINNPATGSIIFCNTCGEQGEFQVYNGSSWTNALGASPAAPIVIQSLGVSVLDYSGLNQELPEDVMPLTLDILPANAPNKTVVWTSNDENIASVDEEGLVTIYGNGQVTITATAQDGGGAAGSIQLSFEPDRPDEETPDGLHIFGEADVILEETHIYNAIMMPFNELDTLALWSSSDESIATINDKGILTPLDTGVVEIVAISSEDASYSDTLSVTIASSIPPDIEAPVLTIDGYDGDNAVQLQRLMALPIPEATAMDNVDSLVEVTITQDDSYNASTFNDSTLTDYRFIYSATDAAGNLAIDSILVAVVDLLPPVITLNDGFEVADTVYTTNASTIAMPTAFAVDDNGDTLAVSIDFGTFDQTAKGLSVAYYQATDPAGNSAADSLFILNSDVIAPSITISGGHVPGETITVGQGIPYTLPTATAVDDDGTVLEVLSDIDHFSVEDLGTYTLKFQATDEVGNQTNVELYIVVADITPPTILNKAELMKQSATFDVGEEIVLTTVEASDNVGVTAYDIFWIPVDEDWQGSVSIDETGAIRMGDPDGTAFEAEFYFRIVAQDAAGLKDSVDMHFIFSRGEIHDIRAKQYASEDWRQLYRYYTPNISYDYQLKENTSVGDTVLYLEANGNPVTSIYRFEFDDTNPGVGTEDFNLMGTGNQYFLTLATPLDQSVRSSYDFNMDVVVRNTTDTTLINRIPFGVNVIVQSIEELAPSFEASFPPATYGDLKSLTLNDILNPIGGVIEGAACPLKPANGILGDLADGLDQLIANLPIIPEDTAKQIAKSMMERLPAYFWATKDGTKTRINIKVPVKGKSLRIEYVIDPDNSGCYWGAILDGLKPSQINSKLSVFDEGTQAGVVVNTIPVTDKSFKCITIPCIKLDPGAHVVAHGKMLPQTGGGGGAAGILNATVYGVVTPLSAGFSDPELTVTFGLKSDFKTEFDNQIIQRLDLASQATRAAILAGREAVKLADKAADAALSQFGIDKGKLDFLDAQIATFTAPIAGLQSQVADANSAVLGIANEIAGILLDDQICTNICPAPCVTPGWCSRSCGFFTCGYPCIRSCGCLTPRIDVCIPNPIAKALAATKADGPLRYAKQKLAYYTSALDRMQQRLAQVRSPRGALQAAFDVSLDALNTANAELATAQADLTNVINQAGPLADIGEFIMDNTINKTVATGKATFITTLGSANSGTYSGQLIVDMSILSSPEVTITFPEFRLTGDGIESSLDDVATIVIDQ